MLLATSASDCLLLSVHSLMLSARLCPCLPFFLFRRTFSCRIVLGSPFDIPRCPYRLNWHLSVVVGRYFMRPSLLLVTLFFISPFLVHSLYEMSRLLREGFSSHLFGHSNPSLQSGISFHNSQAYKNIEMTRECICLTLELFVMFLSFHIGHSIAIAVFVWRNSGED